MVTYCNLGRQLLQVGCLAFGSPIYPSNPGDVVINEVTWMGTAAFSGDDWIELYNTTSSPIDLTNWTLTSFTDRSPSSTLSGTIPAKGYFLLERTDDTTISDIDADQIYTGSLVDGGEDLELKDDSSNLIDTANGNGGTWPAGSTATRSTMGRINRSN